MKLNLYRDEGLHRSFQQQEREKGGRKTVHQRLQGHILRTRAACGVKGHGSELDDTTNAQFSSTEDTARTTRKTRVGGTLLARLYNTPGVL